MITLALHALNIKYKLIRNICVVCNKVLKDYEDQSIEASQN